MEKVIAALTKLRDEVTRTNIHKPSKLYLFEEVLFAFYDFGRSGQQPTKEECDIVGRLIKDTAPLLEFGLLGLAWPFDFDRGGDYFVYRSGIQFLFDICDSFPISDDEGYLGESLKLTKESESLQNLDEETENWIYQFDIFPVSPYEGLDLKESLKLIKESEYLQDLDEEIERWKSEPNVTWESMIYSQEELERPVGVPQTHIWWY